MAGPLAGPETAVSTGMATPPPLTTTTAVTGVVTGTIPLTLHLLGPAAPTATPAMTSARVTIYYDANNNRQPEPGEGVPHVSVLAVDGQGQQLVRAFTNMQGEARFTLHDAAVSRLLVPFVSAWSARVQAGTVNEEIVLGLPAVRLPVFLPVAAPQTESGEEE